MDARAWDERYAAADLVWSAGPNAWVAAELAGVSPGDAVDLACGEGRNALWLAGRGWSVTAVDFSAVAVERGRQRAGALPVAWVVGDVLEVPWPSVDLALLCYLQLTADQRRAVVRRSWSSLRPGGRLLVVAHDATNLTEGTGGPQDAAVLFTALDVLADLPGTPTEVLRADRVPRTVTVADEHGGEAERTAWDCLVHLVR